MIVDRDIETMIRIADRHYIMEKGRFVWTGNSDTLAAEPEIWQHYLGV